MSSLNWTKQLIKRCVKKSALRNSLIRPPRPSPVTVPSCTGRRRRATWTGTSSTSTHHTVKSNRPYYRRMVRWSRIPLNRDVSSPDLSPARHTTSPSSPLLVVKSLIKKFSRHVSHQRHQAILKLSKSAHDQQFLIGKRSIAVTWTVSTLRPHHLMERSPIHVIHRKSNASWSAWNRANVMASKSTQLHTGYLVSNHRNGQSSHFLRRRWVIWLLFHKIPSTLHSR